MIDTFNQNPSEVMHIDLNSCFATIEQQANPLLRGKPLVVAAYDSPGGCILAASTEAKVFGIKTGMRIRAAKEVCPSLMVLEPDPNKYRHVHLALRKIFKKYTNEFYPKSIDEFVLHFSGYPILKEKSMTQIGLEIKKKIKLDIGDFLTVSIGIGPSRFIAKTASNLKKPDGLEEINHKNFLEVYSKLTLMDLNGISYRNDLRLKNFGIRTVIDFYNSPLWKLKAAFASVNGYYWYLRLRGHEIDGVEFSRKSFGNSFALPKSEGGTRELLPILQKLCEKTGQRLRSAGFKAQGISLFLSFRKAPGTAGGFWNHGGWHKSKTLEKEIFDSRDIYSQALEILRSSKTSDPVHTIAVSCFNLKKTKSLQYDLFEDIEKKEKLVGAMDYINDIWGEFSITPARMISTANLIKDRIAFGGVKEL